MGKSLTIVFVGAVALTSVLSLVYVYAFPPLSMQSDRDGVAHFTPSVIHPETGEAIEMSELIRHFRGD